MDKLYESNKDFRDFVDANARTYGKTVEFMLLTPTTKEYAKYLQEQNKGRRVVHENKACGC